MDTNDKVDRVAGLPESAIPMLPGMLPVTLPVTQGDHIIAGLAALAILIHVAETAIPSPLPGVKPGLANVITLLALLQYGWSVACWVALLRVVVGSIVLGTFLGPPFFLSMSGTLGSLLVLGLAWKWNECCTSLGAGVGCLRFGPLGFALMAAMAHMYGQFYAAYWFFIPHDGLFTLLPLLLTSSVVFGLLSGAIVLLVLRSLPQRTPQKADHESN